MITSCLLGTVRPDPRTRGDVLHPVRRSSVPRAGAAVCRGRGGGPGGKPPGSAAWAPVPVPVGGPLGGGVGLVEAPPAGVAESGGVPEGEDPAIAGDEPVAAAIWRRLHAD